MRLTVLFEPRPWIKRRACSRSRTVAPVLHYFRVLRGVPRHHWPKKKKVFRKKESSPKKKKSSCTRYSFFVLDRRAFPWTKILYFPAGMPLRPYLLEIWWVCADKRKLKTMVFTLNQFWKNLYATIPHLSMNDVVTPNTGLYHDQSLFNLIQFVKPLSAGLCGVTDFGMNSFFFQTKYVVGQKKWQNWFFSRKKSQDDKIWFSRKNFGSIRTEARTRDLSRVRRAS